MKIKIENAAKIMVVCILVAALADISDIVYFFFYKAKDGYSFFEPTGIGYKISYMKTGLGFLLTAFGIFPYFIAGLCLKFSK